MHQDLSPRTTVVIPVWGSYGGQALHEAVASLRAQPIPAQILIVDNASDTALGDLDGAEVVRTPNRLTLGQARNFGLQRVQTPYVVVWDADDVMLPGTLELLEREIDTAPDLAAFGLSILEDTGERHRWPRRWVASLSRHPKIFTLVHCIWSVWPTTGSTIMRAELLRDGGGYGAYDSGDDWVAGVSLVFRGRVGWSERPGRVYQIRDGSIWARHMDLSHQVAHAREVRTRIRHDHGSPGWVRRALPLIWLGQHVALIGHVVKAALRRAGISRRADRR